MVQVLYKILDVSRQIGMGRLRRPYSPGILYMYHDIGIGSMKRILYRIMLYKGSVSIVGPIWICFRYRYVSRRMVVYRYQEMGHISINE
jgi:hypothetical protein